MNKENLMQLIEQKESQEVEFKLGNPASHEISQVLCAFANTDGGYLIFGVSPKGNIEGLKCNLDRLQQDISNANQAIHSAPIISTQIFDLDTKKILVVEVNKADDKNAHTFKGAVYVRIGSTTKRLEGQTLIDFLKII